MELVWGLMVTMHLGMCQDCNPLHPFIGVEAPVSDTVTFGGRLFYNSYEDVGLLGGFQVELPDTPLRLDIGLAFGYEAAPVVPMVSLGVQTTKQMKLFVAPITDGESLGAILGMELKF